MSVCGPTRTKFISSYSHPEAGDFQAAKPSHWRRLWNYRAILRGPHTIQFHWRVESSSPRPGDENSLNLRSRQCGFIRQSCRLICQRKPVAR